MTKEISNQDDTIDVRDIIERFETLTDEKVDNTDTWSDGADAELTTLAELLDDLCGSGGDEQWRGDWYPLTLIRDSYFVDAMRELVEDVDGLPKDIPGYLVIDWDATANNLRADYASVEFDGVTYWYC